MSSYIQFFIRKDDVFSPIATYSRSSGVYQAFTYHAPYGRCTALTEKTLDNIREEVREDIEENKKIIAKYERDKLSISNFNNSAEEKYEVIQECNEMITEIEGDIKESERAFNFIAFLYDILEETFSDFNDLDEKKYLYVGFDCDVPTVENVIEFNGEE